MKCSFTFVGGSLDGQRIVGPEADRLYLSTSDAAIGQQIRALSNECKRRIQRSGFVAVHRSGKIEREVYEVVGRRANGSQTLVTCMFVGIERT